MRCSHSIFAVTSRMITVLPITRPRSERTGVRVMSTATRVPSFVMRVAT